MYVSQHKYTIERMPDAYGGMPYMEICLIWRYALYGDMPYMEI